MGLNSERWALSEYKTPPPPKQKRRKKNSPSQQKASVQPPPPKQQQNGSVQPAPPKKKKKKKKQKRNTRAGRMAAIPMVAVPLLAPRLLFLLVRWAGHEKWNDRKKNHPTGDFLYSGIAGLIPTFPLSTGKQTSPPNKSVGEQFRRRLVFPVVVREPIEPGGGGSPT